MQVSTGDMAGLKTLCETYFWFFAKSICDTKFYDDTLHKELCEFLQEQFWKQEKDVFLLDDDGKKIPHNEKCIILPRGFIKTTIAGLFLLWNCLKQPDLRTVVISNTATNAQKTVSEIMGCVDTNELVRALWPEAMPDGTESWNSQAASLKRKKKGGMATFEAIGVGGSVVRRHWDIIIEDDTVAPRKDDMGDEEVMPTQEEIQKAIGFHRTTVPLKVDPVDSWRIVIGTRWAPEDLLQHVSSVEGAVVFDRPALLDENGEPTSDLESGIPTNPKRFPRHVLKQTQKDVGTFLFNSLYLNNPQAKEFMTFHQNWINYWDSFPTEGLHRITVDPADEPTGGRRQDYSAIVSACWNAQGLFVKRSRRGRYTTLQLVENTLTMAEEDGAVQIRVEVNRHAYLKAAFTDAMARRGKYFAIDYFKVSSTKDSRIMSLLPLFESGRIWLHRNAHNMETELLSWPQGKHDDEIDALAAHVIDHVRNDEPVMPKPSREWTFKITLEDIKKDFREQDATVSMGSVVNQVGTPFL